MKKIANRKQYIGTLKECLKARDDFKDLEYVTDVPNSKEYLILSDIVGQVAMLDITNKEEAEIYHMIAQIECEIAPNSFITDKAKKMQIARLR